MPGSPPLRAFCRPIPPLLAACGLLACLACAPEEKPAALILPKVERPSLEREQEPTRNRLLALHDRAERFAADAGKTIADKAAAYGELGRHYAALRQYETAAAAFENAALAQPNDPRWHYLQGVCLQEQGKMTEAATAYERALALTPNDAPTVLHLAEVRFEERRIDLAEPLFEKAVSLAPGCAAALWGLGKVAGEKGEWGRAAEILEKAAKADPGADAIRYSLGLAWRQLGDAEKAQRWLEGSGKKRPHCADKLAEEIGNLINATTLEVLRARVEQADFEPRSDIGYAVGQLGNVLGGAEKMALLAASDTGLRGNPRFEARWRLLTGSLFAHRALDDKAEPELLRATELDPGLGEAWLRLGNLLARRGDYPAALARYDRAAELLPGDVDLLVRRGKVQVSLRRFEDAAQSFRQAFFPKEEDAEAGLELAAVSGHLGRLEEAARLYAKVAQLAPRQRRAREGEATALLLLGRTGDARKSLEQALVDLPEESSLQHALARILAAAPEASLRDPRRALELAQRALVAEPSLDRVETVAMAAAAAGDFAKARELQGRLENDARKAGRGALAERLAARRAFYDAGRAFVARGPEDLIVSPPLQSRAGEEKGAS